MHPLLDDIFKEPRLRTDPTHLVLVLLPPQHSLPEEPRPFDFVANHIIATSWQTMLEQTKIAPRPSLSASVLSHLSPRRSRTSTTSGNMLMGGIRSRSKSTLISNSSSKESSVHRSSSLSTGTCLTTLHGKSVVFYPRAVVIAQQRLTVARETILYDENNLPNHLLLYLDQEIKDLSVSRKSIDEKTSVSALPTGDIMNPLKAMLQKIFNPSHPEVRQFCDTALQEMNLGILHTLTRDLLDKGFMYIDQYLENTPGISSVAQEEAYRICESHVMEETYDVVFFKITQLVRELDVEVSNVLESMNSLGLVQLGLPESRPIRRRVERAADALRRIGSYRTPAEKLESLLESITELSEFHTNSHEDNEGLDSDALVSMTIVTIIRSQVPHLIANITYMKDFTFEQNLEIGKYGFAINTFEAVIQYILESRTQLALVSDRNNQLWTSIRQGDINTTQFILRDRKNSSSNASTPDKRASHQSTASTSRLVSLLPTADLTHMRDPAGNTPLLIAAGAGRPAIVDYILLHDRSTMDATNDIGETALMRACQNGSVETVKLLLGYGSCPTAAQDDKGYTAFLHACVNGDPALIDLLLVDGVGRIDPTIRNYRGQGPLHLAGTADALEYLIQRLPPTIHPWQDYIEGQTFLHVQKKHSIDAATIIPLLSIRNRQGQTPLLAWTSSGWFDCVEEVLSVADDKHLYVHNQGQTILHFMSAALDHSRPPVSVSSVYTVANVVRRLACLVDVRGWANGQTALHLAANLHLTNRNRPFVFDFVRSLIIHAGAHVDSINQRGVRAANMCRDPDMIALLDEMTIEVHRKGIQSKTPPPSIHNDDSHHGALHRYTFCITRATSHHSAVRYTIASDSTDHPHRNVDNGRDCSPLIWKEGLKIVERTLDDFYQLRKDIMQERPESFLPTLRHLVDPEHVELHPEPPMCFQEEVVRELDGFMRWLETHPTLRDHDLVQTFVQSQTLEREAIKHASFARRDLLLEAIGKLPLSGNDFGGSEDEEYFFSFSQRQIEALRVALTGVILAGRRVTQCRQDLEIAANQTGHLLETYVDGDSDGNGGCCEKRKNEQSNGVVLPGSNTSRLCIAMTGDTAYGSSPLDDLVRGFQMMRDLTDGILMALQRPLWLLHRRIELRDHLEHERDHLRRIKTWNEVFSTKRRQVEQTQENVVKTLSDLARAGSQIAQSHQMISDEMAHFQRVHPVQLKTMIKSYCRAQLLQERLKLFWLQEQAGELATRRAGQ